jgi:non-ribosomal peptide synthetase component F
MSLAVCPRCNLMLAATGTLGIQRCRSCEGEFRRDSTDDGEPAPPPVISGDTEAAVGSSVEAVSCPHCLNAMRPAGEAFAFDCRLCGGSWLDSDGYRLANIALEAQSTEAPPPHAPTAEPESSFTKDLLYGLSLPERFLRSGIGLTAGAVKEMAGVLIPQAFHSAKSYEIAIDKSLTFLTETIGGVASTGPTAPVDEAGAHIARKAVGNFVDLAGLATLHVSPMWILAAVSDIAYGSKTYVYEVANELKAQGVIDDTSTIHQIDDILEAIQRSSGTAASTFDTPPLSVEELRQSLQQTREELQRADVKRLLPEAELRRMWVEMQTVANQEGVGLLEVSSTMTMQLLNRVKTVSNGALTSVRVAGGLLNRTVLDHYRGSLADIRDRGFYEVLADSYGPYVEAVWRNFTRERATWTEQLLDPENLTRTVNRLFRFLEGDEETQRKP